MSRKFTIVLTIFAMVFGILIASHAAGLNPVKMRIGPGLSDLQYLPGDSDIETSVRVQTSARIAPGGSGYLAVWRDERTVLSQYITAPYYPLMGNQRDIYAARFDSSGNLLDRSPVIVSNAPLDQTQPEVGWNGQNWLVVWVTQRADWYFFQDIVGVRVSPEGVILDSIPIPIRLENNSPANDYGRNPTVTSDGTNWVVVWEDQTWSGSTPYPNVAGTRIAPDGTILDNAPIVLYVGATPATFGPISPQMRQAGDELLLVWEHSGYYQLLGKRFTTALQQIDPQPFTIASSNASSPRLASNGTDFFVVSREEYGYRVRHDGSILDPNGIYLGVPGPVDRGPDISWDGAYWAAAFSGGSLFYGRMYLTRVAPNGKIVPPGPTQIQFGSNDQYNAAIASPGSGSVVVAWDDRSSTLQSAENIRSVRVNGDWSVASDQDVSIGLHRQSYIRFASNGAEHMAVYTSQGGGLTRVLAQRVDADGNPVDPEPTVVGSADEGYSGSSGITPEVAFNGSVYMVVWSLNGSLYGRRLQVDGTPIEPAPVNLLTDNVVSSAIGALGANFYLAYTYTFSGDQRYLKGARVDGDNMSLLDTPTLINGGSTLFALNPVVRSPGDRWLVVWEAQVSHDIVSSTVRGLFVTSGGQAGNHFAISQSGDADEPDVAISDGRALIVWHEYTIQDGLIRGRLMDLDGSFPGGQFLVCDAPNRQFYPAAAWDGQQFTVAWTDYRSIQTSVEQLRGDIYAGRVTYDGEALDPNGIQLTSGPLPDDLPAVVGAGGKSLIAFSILHGTSSPEIQRIGYRVLETRHGSWIVR